MIRLVSWKQDSCSAEGRWDETARAELHGTRYDELQNKNPSQNSSELPPVQGDSDPLLPPSSPKISATLAENVSSARDRTERDGSEEPPSAGQKQPGSSLQFARCGLHTCGRQLG